MRIIVAFLAVLAVAIIAGCEDDTNQPHTYDVTFIFALRGEDPMTVRFEAVTRDTAVIRQAREELNKPISDRRLFPTGPIERIEPLRDPLDTRRLLQNDHTRLWRFVPNEWTLTDVSIELCDGTPGEVDSNLAYWVDTVGQFCPWQAYVLQAVLPAPDRIVR